MPTLFYETATRTIEKRKVQNIATYLKARFKIKWALSLFTPGTYELSEGIRVRLRIPRRRRTDH